MLKLYGIKQQGEIIFSRARFNGVFMGRRGGKSMTFCNRAIYRACKNRMLRYWYIAPTNAQCEEMFEKMTGNDGFMKVVAKKSGTRRKPYFRITLKNGSEISFRHFQKPKYLRGSGIDEVWIDEVQDIAEQDFWSVVRALIADRRGNIFVSGQFRGKNWCFKEFFLKGQYPYKVDPDTEKPVIVNGVTVPQTLYKSWKIPTSEGLMYQGSRGREELSLLRDTTPPAIWDQEFECIPTGNIRAVFPDGQIDRILSGYASEPVPGMRYIMGLDLGRSVDQSAVTVLEINTGRIVHAELFPLRMEHAIQAQKAKQIANKYHALVVMDATGGAAGGHGTNMDEHLRYYRQVIPNLREFIWTFSNKGNILAFMGLEIQNKQLTIPAEFKELIRQLKAYEFKYANGVYRYSAPSGEHDDYVQSLAMALWGRKCGWVSMSGGAPLTAGIL